MNTSDHDHNDELDSNDEINNDIAIIGMAGRFPKADNIDEFWTNLVSSQDCITRFTLEELEKFGVAPVTLSNPHFVPAAGHIRDQEMFDAHFFEMNPREAESIDPQHRFALEVAWQTLEHAGYTPESVNGSIGVFGGVNTSTYFIFNLLTDDQSKGVGDALDALIGADKDMFASRISYKLNLKGPSVALGTACSTSLVCIHLACQSLLNGESKMALAGGSHIATPNTIGHIFHEGGYSSPDGYCRSFDAKGRGTVAGAGTCFVLLKRMEDALEDRDTIYAVIKGSAVNNDGSDKIGYTAPSISGQTSIIAEAQAVAGVEPESIRFIEAHGTATELGDPIEFAALTRAFRLQTDKKNFCGIGSVKSNIGHLGVAAGAASVVKAALSLKHKMIPESLNFETPNPKLDIANSPFYVIDQLEKITPGEYPARAGVSSLGIGGTNAHIVLEEAPLAQTSQGRAWQLLVLSAKTSGALDRMTENLAQTMHKSAGDPQALALADVAYTLHVGRKPFAFRRVFVLADGALEERAASIAPNKGFSGRAADKTKKIVFMFPGGGTQYVNMARGLYESETEFAKTFDTCAHLFKKKMGLDVVDLIYCNAEQAEANTQTLQRPKNFFAALFCIEYSLAKLWMSWGVKPDALIGHSLGEYIAACIAGVFSLSDAVELICFRGELFEKIDKGAMFSVTAPAQETEKLLIDGVSIATINDPGRCAVAGRFEPMQAFEKVLQQNNIEYKRLLIDTAGHSPMVDSVLGEFARFAARIKFNKPSIPIISNISGDWADPAEICTVEYWTKHLRQTVRFSQGVETLLKDGNSVFLEVGPGNALCSFVRSQALAKPETVLLTSLRHVQEEKADVCHLLETAGRLWLAGVPMDWAAFYAGEQRSRVGLPTYPFERKRYWVEQSKSKASTGAKLAVADWLWQPGWRLAEVPRAAHTFGQQDMFLVLVDKQGLAANVMEALREQGARAIALVQGASYAELDSNNFQINANDPAQYRQLVSRLAELGILPKTVVHGWSLLSEQSDKQSEVNAQLSFVYLTQALAFAGATEPLNMVALTHRRETVLAGDVVDSRQALITGPANVIPYEYRHIRFGTIDVDLDRCENKQLVDLVVNELGQLSAQKDGCLAADQVAIALRSGLRFARQFTALSGTDAATGQADIKAGGVYLITGGLGGVGMVHAQAFAKFQTRLALVQRTAFPSANGWDAIAADPAADLILKEQIKGIRALQALGSEVLVLQADVTDLVSVQKAVRQVRDSFGAIDGLVHCAGYGEFVPIKETSQELIDAVLAPKVMGTQVLLQALTGEELSLVLLCSSMSAQTTGYGLVGYVGACAYLDATAHALTHAQGPTGKTRYLSINWDVWDTPQQSIKLRSGTTTAPENKAAITPREGVEVIYRALGSGLTQVVVSTTDLLQLLRKNEKMAEVLRSAGGEADLLAEAPKAELSLYDRPSLSSEYVAPSTPQEVLLASIWQETLGIRKIGVNDNFFELGGESLLGVKIVVQAKKMGLFFEPKQMFSTPTIVQILQNATTASAVQVEQSQVRGDCASVPIQQKFLNKTWTNKSHWNVGTLLGVKSDVNATRLRDAVEVLLSQHEVLGSHFVCGADGAWRQVFDGARVDPCVAFVDLSSHESDAFATALQQQCMRLQAGFDVGRGPIFAVAYFKAATLEQSRVAVLAHHLVMDALSLGIVLEDLVTLLQLPAGAALAKQLPPKTSSFKDYSAALLQQVSGGELVKADLDFWTSQASDIANYSTVLTPEIANGRNTEQDVLTVSSTLSAEHTQRLQQDTTRHSQLKLHELLLAAAAKTWADWQHQPLVLIDTVHHGRPDISGVDLSRTVGWFGVGAPLPLRVSSAALASQLLPIKAQMEAVPNKGLGLAWLQEWHADGAVRKALASIPAAAVSFNYLGQVDQVLSDASVADAQQSIQGLREPGNERLVQHELLAYIQNGKIHLAWNFSQGQYRTQTVQGLLDTWVQHLIALTETAWDSVSAQRTAVDLSSATLAAHSIAPDQVEAYYPLTAFQSEIFRLYSDKSRPLSNITQALTVLEGSLAKNLMQSMLLALVPRQKLVRNLLQSVWQALVSRHPVLRTRFLLDANGQPVQVVCKEAAFELLDVDYSNLDEAAQESALQQLLVQDRRTPYDLSQAPALRVYWVNLNPKQDRFAILMSNHQIILDGWTTSLLAKDLLECLAAIAGNAALPAVAKASYFSRYAQWISKQDPGAGLRYWREAFAGYRAQEPLQAIMAPAPLLAPGVDAYAEHMFDISPELLTAIAEAARVSQTTSNAVFQGAWALSLAQLSSHDDIVYGVTVSGRACDLDGITQVVGQCTNSLPVRIGVPAGMRVVDLLQSVHTANSNAQANNLQSLTQIAELVPLGAGLRLYSSNFIFENIPRAESAEADMPIKTLSSAWVDGWQFPLRVFVVPEDKTWVRLAFDANLFTAADIARLAKTYGRILAGIVRSGETPVAQLMREN